MKAAPRSRRQAGLHYMIGCPRFKNGSSLQTARRTRKLAKRLSSKEGRQLDKAATKESL